MDFAELLFALHVREVVLKDLEREFPQQMSSSLTREPFIRDRFESYLLANLDDIKMTARLVRGTSF